MAQSNNCNTRAERDYDNIILGKRSDARRMF